MSRMPAAIGKHIRVGAGQPLLLIAGPCQLESEAHSIAIAEALQSIAARHRINLVFKASFDKANRTSLEGRRGPGHHADLWL